MLLDEANTGDAMSSAASSTRSSRTRLPREVLILSLSDSHLHSTAEEPSETASVVCYRLRSAFDAYV
jgi:hypothetical protein